VLRVTRHIDFLIIGGGLAAATAAETLRSEGAEGTILILSAEASLPYQRPPLSKRFLSANLPVERILVLNEEIYRQRSIEVMLSTVVVAVDPDAQVVVTKTAGDFHYGKLLIATGTTPVDFNAPGADLSGIYSLHTVEDARALKQAAASAKRALVVGGGDGGVLRELVKSRSLTHIDMVEIDRHSKIQIVRVGAAYRIGWGDSATGSPDQAPDLDRLLRRRRDRAVDALVQNASLHAVYDYGSLRRLRLDGSGF